jgi:hypothetical protein
VVTRSALISDELARFLESGISINVATRDEDLQSDGAVAWAVRVHDDGVHLTLFLHKEAAAAMMRNLKAHPEIAVAFDRPTTHRACQVKGRMVSTRPGRAAERAEVNRQVEGFFTDMEGIGIPRAMVSGFQTWPCVAIQMRVTEIFEQTPGPGAGEPLQ